jgi:hypothetical protein
MVLLRRERLSYERQINLEGPELDRQRLNL